MSDVQPTDPRTDPILVEEFPVDRIKRRLGRRMGGRPLMVYVVLFAGAATLLLLLAVVWISATNNDDEAEICTEIAPAEAQAAVLDGQVRRVRVLVDQDQPVQTLTGVVLEFLDDACRQTPQGAGLRNELFQVLGAVELYNQFNDTGVAITYTQQDIQRELLATSTPPPTETPLVPTAASPSAIVADLPTVTVAPVDTPRSEPTATGAAAATQTAIPPVTIGSPSVGTVQPSPSPTPPTLP